VADGPAPDATAWAPDAAITGWSFETLETTTVRVIDRDLEATTLRAHRPDGGRSYLLFVRAGAGPRPVVVMEQPYDAIDWTGEDVDARWAARGPGLHPDDEAPDYDGNDVIAYAAPVSISDAANQNAVHLLNGSSVVLAYARFYAGGDLEDDVLDASAPFHFVASRPEDFDTSRIAVFGGSWGGLMTLFGAARAPAGARPATLTPISPPSDLADIVRWATVDLPAVFPEPARAEAFFSTYLRRIRHATGGDPDDVPDAYARFSRQALCEGITGRVLVAHDDWDTLVPVRQTESFAAACPEHVSAVYWHRPEPIDYVEAGLDHGLFGREPGFPTPFTFALARIALGNASSETALLAMGHQPAIETFLGTVREAQRTGSPTDYALAPMRDLLDPRLILFDPVLEMGVSSQEVTTAAINAVWGTTLTPAEARAALEMGFPP
jgi:acetyl esterase/lipase